MKNASSILVFVIAFVAVTAIMIFLNTKFNSMFKFDFSSPHSTALVKDSTKNESKMPGVEKDEATGKTIKDTTVADDGTLDKKVADALDKVYNETDDKTKTPEVNQEKKQEVATLQPKTEEKKVVQTAKPNINNKPPVFNKNNSSSNFSAKVDSSYIRWKLNTAAIYEKMDSKKAAKIIENYTDNIARDLIYAMKSKKAAEILSEIRPDIAQKITQMKK